MSALCLGIPIWPDHAILSSSKPGMVLSRKSARDEIHIKNGNEFAPALFHSVIERPAFIPAGEAVLSRLSSRLARQNTALSSTICGSSVESSRTFISTHPGATPFRHRIKKTSATNLSLYRGNCGNERIMILSRKASRRLGASRSSAVPVKQKPYSMEPVKTEPR